jgi:hypothetical protein
MRINSSLALLACALGIVSSSCSRKGSTPSGPIISGKVTLKGAPVTGGSMTFLPQKGSPTLITIMPDGTYKASGVPTGEILVGIETESIRGKAPKDGKLTDPGVISKPPSGVPGTAPMAVYVPIDKKYADPKTSGLTVTISEQPEQTKDFDLKD